MAKMLHDDFEVWIRDRARGCEVPEIVHELCKGEMDFDSGEYTFENPGVQAQWEAWQAAHQSFRAAIGRNAQLHNDHE